jgi:hypothetical protein
MAVVDPPFPANYLTGRGAEKRMQNETIGINKGVDLLALISDIQTSV